jgi:hypothetical protein
MSPLGANGPEDEATASFVPAEIRDDDNYEGFALLVDGQQRRRWFNEIPFEHDA